ncbi:DUF2141 domain-containing protein [Algoriphagus persicinus]|uniref:DUF2141 domain-containing protein n=1 Tax=Algoriphagus persicinus TaxID=3108754 RepID=UPI002B398661|nr:DUF2141 domain-containing protein [Algoriphagus sp. E1-3-M2]MEB2785348.1 DUF2141 domain-containing protein [Algoriphagus sp. E1-3-M2]
MKHIIKKCFMYSLLIGLFSFTLNGQKGNYSLTINVGNLRNSKGVVQYALYNKDGSIPDEKYEKYVKKGIAEINNASSTLTFDDLPAGKYAISILHDENKNGKIDKKILLPIPSEGVGISNYQSIGFSNRPNFLKASFLLNSSMAIEVKIIYM